MVNEGRVYTRAIKSGLRDELMKIVVGRKIRQIIKKVVTLIKEIDIKVTYDQKLESGEFEREASAMQ